MIEGAASPPTARERDRVSPADIVRDVVRMIHRRQLRPGERIREQDLADRHGVSRGPVREALRMLEAKAIIEVAPMRGATVRRMSDAEIMETVDIAAALFGLAARRAAERASAEQQAAIAAAADALKPLVDSDISPRRFFIETVRVGQLVVVAARSPRVAEMLADVRAGWPNILGALGFTSRPLRRRAAAKWVRLAEAVRDRQPMAAERLAIEVHQDVAAEANRVGFR